MDFGFSKPADPIAQEQRPDRRKLSQTLCDVWPIICVYVQVADGGCIAGRPSSIVCRLTRPQHTYLRDLEVNSPEWPKTSRMRISRHQIPQLFGLVTIELQRIRIDRHAVVMGGSLN